MVFLKVIEVKLVKIVKYRNDLTWHKMDLQDGLNVYSLNSVIEKLTYRKFSNLVEE